MLWPAAIFALLPPPEPVRLQAVCGAAEIQDFGLLCTADEPCPVYLELSYVAPNAQRIFVTGNFHTENATLWSVLLMSADAGNTWSEPAARIRGAVLDLLRFPAPTTGFAGGGVASPLLRDPFLLKSTDSGSTWRRIPLFDDSHAGVIEQMTFLTPDRGELLLDMRGGDDGNLRSLTLQTLTGGDTWIPAAAGAARPAAPRGKETSSSPDWRIRTDAAAKAYRIEQRTDGRWTTLASFAVAAGQCKPEDNP
jgi:photosystem II stability/assembly factor-like uncharacterized protein